MLAGDSSAGVPEVNQCRLEQREEAARIWDFKNWTNASSEGFNYNQRQLKGGEYLGEVQKDLSYWKKGYYDCQENKAV